MFIHKIVLQRHLKKKEIIISRQFVKGYYLEDGTEFSDSSGKKYYGKYIGSCGRLN
jgi:hypothetical protein